MNGRGEETPSRRVGWKLFSISRPDCETAPVVSASQGTAPEERSCTRPRFTSASAYWLSGPFPAFSTQRSRHLTAFEEERAQTICAIIAFLSLSHSQRARHRLLGGHRSRWRPDAGWEVASVAVYPPSQAHLQGPQRPWGEAYHQQCRCL